MANTEFNPQTAYNGLSEEAQVLFKYLIQMGAFPLSEDAPEGEKGYETYIEEEDADYEAAEELVEAGLCNWDNDLLFVEEETRTNLPKEVA